MAAASSPSPVRNRKVFISLIVVPTSIATWGRASSGSVLSWRGGMGFPPRARERQKEHGVRGRWQFWSGHSSMALTARR